MSNALLSWIYGAITVKSIDRHECMRAAQCYLVCMQNMKEGKPSGSFSKTGRMHQGQRSAINYTNCLFYCPVMLRLFCITMFWFSTQMTPWCAPSPTPTLSSTPRWCPSTCLLSSLCWSTSASTSSSEWDGRGSPSARPAGKCSQTQRRRLWWDNHVIFASWCFIWWH